ncbi:siderophore-interacting protein [Aestuariivirga sp.]|uniref:siderophore-interacting protein n=1 Tax=Aestuariivirga sp. TaxID=2650926 RepID=UPI0039E69E7C
MDHAITRHRYELKKRALTVRNKTHITPNMIRIVLEGEDLADFDSRGADDHVKIFVGGNGAEERRDYTPRRFDAKARTLTLDFALHEAGPATHWAIAAKPGDALMIGGPRGSTLVPPSFDWWLLIGDETALPAIGRRIEELPAKARVIALAAVTDAAEEQSFETKTSLSLHWVHRPATSANDPDSLLSALGKIALPPGDGFVWIGAEARVARALRDYMVKERGHPLHWLKASGYWLQGVADAHDKLEN